jgi:thiol:disulfide interchange protein
MQRLLLLTTLILLFGGPFSAVLHSSESGAQRDEHVVANMLAEREAVVPGETIRLGLLLKHDPRWHTYWKSTATGYATSIRWELPAGFSAGPILWPTPKIYEFQGWIEYVYDDSVLLITEIKVPEAVTSDTVTFAFTAEWLMCEDVCIPGDYSASLSLPVVDSLKAAPLSTFASLFSATEERFPLAGDSLNPTYAEVQKNALQVSVNAPEVSEEVIFFDAKGVFEPHQAIPVKVDANGRLVFTLELNESEDTLPDQIEGVLRFASGTAYALKDNLSESRLNDKATAQGPQGTLLGWLGLAFVGGLILNLMPCVFPVLGIKIMGFVQQAGEERSRIVAHGLTFTLGVLLSFWLLASVLLILRSGGDQLGWGFQLQSPAFVYFLILLLFAFALNMSGLFEFGQSAVGVGSELAGKSGYSGSFFSGVLATVVATPCAAPFLAPALGAALTLPPLTSMLVFSSIALGLSAPYLVLSLFPSLTRLLPRPGPWMESFKQFMAFLLYATVAFLLWVLDGQLTESAGFTTFALLKVLFSLVGLAMALWVFGRWAAFHRPKVQRYGTTLVALLMIIGSIALAFPRSSEASAAAAVVKWEEWAPGKAARIAAAGQPVYVDFTARWCLTCQTNKAAVFSSKEVRDTIREQNIVLLKADWTNRDPLISEALESFGRSAVPFNLVYLPGEDQPRQLPEILTPGLVLEALRKGGD